MTGHEYEHTVASYLSHRGYKDVQVTKGSGDYGVDVIAQKGLKKYAVQCKYYSDPVSVGAVQEAVAGKAMYNCNAAMVVTNSTFTRAAEELARKNNVVLISGVKSSGVSVKNKLIFASMALAVLVVLCILGEILTAVETLEERLQLGGTSQMIIDIVVLALLVCIPIVAIILIKRTKRKKAIRAERAVQEETKKNSEIPYESNNVNCPQPTYTKEELIKEIRKYLQPYITDDADPTFEEALFIALSEKRITTSLLQMRLGIGYLRATKIINQMEAYGIVSPSVDNKPRTILISAEELMSRIK